MLGTYGRNRVRCAMLVAACLVLAGCALSRAGAQSDVPTSAVVPTSSMTATQAAGAPTVKVRDAAAMCTENAKGLGRIGIPGGETAIVVAAYGTSAASLSKWQARMDAAFGITSAQQGTPLPEETSPAGDVLLCYFDGDFGPPRGAAPSDIGDYTRVVVFVDSSNRLTPLIEGFKASLPIMDPDKL